ncbi:MAG TPA: recombinase RecA [Candidatus Pacebacteria bacterium]|nr:MAG: Protein RecA [Microgenomates group bacterium GW2011_GWB1_45_17]KKU23696.1 MAG: Protein RecA [Microgenomates group bacterium GW2011_GWA1_46_15]KKU24596.1 MAG: Protein RecA [Microgenomates group bacterium GW2011_GWC1_46_15]HAV15258.1 recombinase RecA [Candidatus Paceibacterota bacterium]HCR10973.1 recombinase RecA [Candidatus Paceibacterota bacterium]
MSPVKSSQAKTVQQTVPGSVSNLKQQRMQAVNIALQQIEKTYGKGSIMKLGESMQHQFEVPSISTGSIALDLALGVGGMPRGRIAEIFGPEASGKTTVCLHVIAEAQKAGGTVAFIDAEHALDPKRAEAIGVKLDDLLISQPDTGEQALEITETLIRSGGLDVIVVDSVAALVPKAEIEGEMGDASMGMQARLMSQAMRKLTAAINKSKTLLIFTNQLRMKIGVMFGNPETTSGGQALKFYTSIRIDMRKIGNITDGDVVIGSRHRAKIVKNKVAPPFRTAEFDIMNSSGISKSGSIVDVAAEMNILEKAGSFFKYKGNVLAQGRDALKIELEKSPKLMNEIEGLIRAKIKGGKSVPRDMVEVES